MERAWRNEEKTYTTSNPTMFSCQILQLLLFYVYNYKHLNIKYYQECNNIKICFALFRYQSISLAYWSGVIPLFLQMTLQERLQW